MYDGYFKRAFHAELTVVDGAVRCDAERDVLKVAIVDRHHATKTIGIGFVRGFQLKQGAMAATTNCENQNLVMVGTTDRDLAYAARAIEEIGGGYVAVADGKVLATVPLPIAGIMSDQPWETVREQSINANTAAPARLRDPFALHHHGVHRPRRRARPRPDRKGSHRDRSRRVFTDLVLGMRAGLVCCRCPDHMHDVHRLMDPTSFRAEPVQ